MLMPSVQQKKHLRTNVHKCFFVAGPGYDPGTSGLWIRRSNQLSYPAIRANHCLFAGAKVIQSFELSKLFRKNFAKKVIFLLFILFRKILHLIIYIAVTNFSTSILIQKRSYEVCKAYALLHPLQPWIVTLVPQKMLRTVRLKLPNIFDLYGWNALKGQKLLAQGNALGIKAVSKAPCKGKSLKNPCN